MEWKTELSVESLRWTLDGGDEGAPGTSHRWGSPLYVGVFLATTHTNAVGIVMDELRAEWSPKLARFLEQSFK